MEKVKDDITGNKYNRLKVVKFAFRKGTNVYWQCKCECGTIKNLPGSRIKNGDIKSCGCLRKEVTAKMATIHGKHGTPLYNTWKGMRGRCNSPNNGKYYAYGERGISICSEWEDFVKFEEWARSNGYREGLTIERIDVNGNYEPSNCEWIPAREQQYNKRNTVIVEINGEKKHILEWARQYNIKKNTIYGRYHRGDRGKQLIREVE